MFLLQSNNSVGSSISESNVQMLQKQFLNSGKMPSSTQSDRISRSNDDLVSDKIHYYIVRV